MTVVYLRVSVAPSAGMRPGGKPPKAKAAAAAGADAAVAPVAVVFAILPRSDVRCQILVFSYYYDRSLERTQRQPGLGSLNNHAA